MNDFRLPDSTRIAHVHLQIPDLRPALDFYGDLIGFQEIRLEERLSRLSASGREPAILLLSEKPEGRPKPPRTSGLYHLAIRFPSRRELALVFRRLAEARYPFQGFSDHGVSEAIYLADPAGNGVELYTDRPREQWPWRNGQVGMVSEPLDVDDLLQEIESDPQPWSGAHSQTVIGHVHIQVSDLTRTEAFYHGLVGLDVTQRNYPGALFLSAGGYHHHLGANTWAGRGAAPPPAGAHGLRSFGFHLPEAGSWLLLLARLQGAGVEVETWFRHESVVGFLVRDPDQIGVEFVLDEASITPEAHQVLHQHNVDLP